MTNNEKEYFIYIPATKEKILVSKTFFNDYYRKINAYRKTKQNNGQCRCPSSKRLLCTMDCFTCPYQIKGSTISLDEALVDNEGHQMSKLDYLQGKENTINSLSIEDIVLDSIEMNKLLQRLSELMPEALEIGYLRQSGLSDNAISAKIDIPRTTFLSRLNKVKKILELEFPNIF